MTPAQPNNAVLLERLESLRCDISELKESMSKIALDYQAFQREYMREHATLEISTKRNHERLETLEKEHAALMQMIQPLLVWNKIVAFVASALGISILALVWGIIIGQVQLIIP